jgi:hypothetical protein
MEFETRSRVLQESLVAGDFATIESVVNQGLAAWSRIGAPDAIIDLTDDKGLTVTHNLIRQRGGRVKFNITGGNSWKAIFDGIEPIPFKWSDLGSEDWDDEIDYIRPWNKALVNDEQWKIAMDYASRLTPVGHFLRFRNLLFVMRMAGGDVRTDPFWGRLKYYYDTLGVDEPFFESADLTRVTVKCDDAAVVVRMFILLNAWIVQQSYHELNAAPDIEIAEYLFNDPVRNNKELKSMLGVLRQSVFSMSDAGLMVSWNNPGLTAVYPALARYQVLEIEANDKVYYSVMYYQIREDLLKLRAAGLYLTEDIATKLISAKVSDVSMREAVWLGAIIAIPGYTRTDTKKTFNKKPRPPEDRDVPMAKILEDEMDSVLRTAIQEGRVMDYRTWRRNVPSNLTGKSSGGWKGKVLATLPTGNAGFGGATTRRATEVELQFTSKRAAYIMNPDVVFGREYIRAPYTVSNPGTVGSRDVVAGKPSRMISARRVATYAAELIISNAINDIMQRIDREDPTPIGTPNDFATLDSGSIFVTHSYNFFATTISGIIIDGTDYTGFDTTEQWWNTLKYLSEGAKRAFKRAGLLEPFGDIFTSMIDFIDTIWGDGIATGAVYKLPGGVETGTIETDQVLSGEHLTFAKNSIANRANVKVQEERRTAKYGDLIRMLHVAILGDDLSRWLMLSDVNRWTKTTYMNVVNIHMGTTLENGFDTNLSKSVMRSHFGEFLKVTVCYGVHIPLAHMQMIAAEKNSLQETSTLLQGYLSKLKTMCSRGFSAKVAMHIMIWTYRLRTGVQIRTREFRKTYYPPMITLFTPVRMGGMGMWPNMYAGISMDGPLAVLSKYNPEYKRRCEIASGIVEVRTDEIRRQLARDAVSGKNISPRDAFQPGLVDMRGTLLGERIRTSDGAANALIRRGVRPKRDYSYKLLPERMIEQSIQSEKAFQRLFTFEGRNVGAMMERNAAQGRTVSFERDFDWLLSMDWAFYTPEPVQGRDNKQQLCPVAGITGDTRKVLIDIGVGADRDQFSVRIPDVMRILRKDPNARRDLTGEQIFNILAAPEIAPYAENILDTLVYMGFRPAEAAQVSVLLTKNVDPRALKNAATLAGGGAALFAFMNSGRENTDRLARVPELLNLTANAAASLVAFEFAIASSMDKGGLVGVEAKPTENTLSLVTDRFGSAPNVTAINGGY